MDDDLQAILDQGYILTDDRLPPDGKVVKGIHYYQGKLQSHGDVRRYNGKWIYAHVGIGPLQVVAWKPLD